MTSSSTATQSSSSLWYDLGALLVRTILIPPDEPEVHHEILSTRFQAIDSQEDKE